MGNKRPAVFLDRDGTLNVDREYVAAPEDVELVPNAARGARMLQQAGFSLVVVSNQSGIARGLITEAQADSVEQRLRALLAAEGITIEAFYRCPHLPGAPLIRYDLDCECRKPKPGLLVAAANDLNLDLAQSWAVGDRSRDVAAGAAAGCRTVAVAHVPAAAEQGAQFGEAQPLYRARDLVDAAKFIIANSQ